METASCGSRLRGKGWIAWAGALIGAAGHTGEKERDGRVDLILKPVVQQ